MTKADIDTSCRILLVDDEENFRFSASLVLKGAGWEVTTAADGREALEILLNKKGSGEEYHLVITDIAMPGMDGLELLDHMMEHGIVVPTLVITGFLDAEYREALQLRGVSNTLEKPFMPELFKEMISHILIREGNCKG